MGKGNIVERAYKAHWALCEVASRADRMVALASSEAVPDAVAIAKAAREADAIMQRCLAILKGGCDE